MHVQAFISRELRTGYTLFSVEKFKVVPSILEIDAVDPRAS